MKNLTKLQINPEKLINNEELITLRGGYDVNTICYRNSGGGDCYIFSPWCDLADFYCGLLCPGYEAIMCGPA
jgi:hypothetical protein